ncbi:MAG: NAD(P)-binding domain-containing protein, partial [Sphaerochaetaceae bacterium]
MGTESLGFIGLGVMGHSMCSHLLENGHKIHVFNRTMAKAQDLILHGAVAEECPAAIARNCSIVFTMLGYPQDVEEVYFGKEGLLSNPHEGQIFVDMTTTKPSLAIRIAEEAEKRDCFACDAPVSGGDSGA